MLILRGIMIGAGAALLHHFEWVLYAFGVILLLTAGRMFFNSGEADPKKNIFLRIARRFFPITHEFHDHRFIVRRRDLPSDETIDNPSRRQVEPNPSSNDPKGDRYVLTPLLLTLVVIETTDVVFAVDSIPAIFAITTDPFLVFSSNICAVLGLRSLYFALIGMISKFEYLKTSLIAILAFVGVKMLANPWIEHFPGINYIMLGVVFTLLAVGVAVSLIKGEGPKANPLG